MGRNQPIVDKVYHREATASKNAYYFAKYLPIGPLKGLETPITIFCCQARSTNFFRGEGEGIIHCLTIRIGRFSFFLENHMLH